MKPIITFTAVRIGDQVAKSAFPRKVYSVIHKSDSERWLSLRAVTGLADTPTPERMAEHYFNLNEFVLTAEAPP